MLLLLVACAPQEAPPVGQEANPAPQAVTLALNWYAEPEFGGLYEAERTGLYQQAGLAVTLQPGGAGAPVLPQVAAGRVQFGIAMADEVLLARARGADLVTVLATFQTSPLGIMVHESRGLTKLEELKTGLLAVEDGIPFAQYLFAKMDWKDLRRVPYGGGVSSWMLDPNYAQQAYVTSEPFLARAAGGDPQVFLVADAGYNPYANIVVTSGKLAKEDPDLVRRFVQATRQGWESYLKDGKATNARISELNPAMTAEVAAHAWSVQRPLIEGADPQSPGLGRMVPERWTTLAGQLQELGLLPAGADPSAAWTNRFLDPAP